MLPHLWMHLFKVWKMLILLVGTSLWGRGKNSTFATHGDFSTDGTYGKMPTPGYLWGPCFTTRLVRTTSSLTVSRKLHNRLSCLMHPFKVWKMLILLVGTSLWGRGKNSTFATYGDLSTDRTYGNMPTPGYLRGPCFTTPLVRTTSSLTVSRKLHNRLSCLLPRLLMHPFIVWKMLILFKLVGTSLWGRW